MNRRCIPLTKVDFWVQTYNLPMNLFSDRIAKAIGSYLGEFIQADSRNFDGLWKSFMRIRVSLDITKPLKRKMKIKKADGDWFWADFKYERLPTFCFICRIIGHAEKFCPKLFEGGIDKETAGPYRA